MFRSIVFKFANIITGIMILNLVLCLPVKAQENSLDGGHSKEERAGQSNGEGRELIKKTQDITKISSLFFTGHEIETIQSALDERKSAQLNDSEEDSIALDREYIRNISLGGILYNSSEDWTIWLNKQRVTPSAIPGEVLSLKVEKDFIEIKWLDGKTSRIIPVRLRAHQEFNLDSMTFVTGD